MRPMMRRTTLGIVMIGLAVLAMGAADEEQGLTPIFNGKDLTGWKAPEPNPWWKAQDGVLVGQSEPAKKGNVIYTEKSYKDLVLEADCRWNGEIDSGFFFRKPQLQVQIGVSRSEKRDLTCSLQVWKTQLKTSERTEDQDKLSTLEKVLKFAEDLDATEDRPAKLEA